MTMENLKNDKPKSDLEKYAEEIGEGCNYDLQLRFTKFKKVYVTYD